MTEKLAVFTCDTEFTPPWNTGTWDHQDPWTFEAGIETLQAILAKHGVRGTFYCEGTLAEQYPVKVRELSKGHLIGSHGYNHENYGGREVRLWTKTTPKMLNDQEKWLQLLKAKKAVREAIGQDPEVFVAPFDWVDPILLGMLSETGFKIDSSYHNYSLGLPTHFFRPLGIDILELPLSVVHCGPMRYKNVLEAFTYDRKFLSSILLQEILLITCHPYEFTSIQVPHPRKVLIVGDEKEKALNELISTLKEEGYWFVDPLRLRDIFYDQSYQRVV